jgi:hypothetical protein
MMLFCLYLVNPRRMSSDLTETIKKNQMNLTIMKTKLRSKAVREHGRDDHQPSFLIRFSQHCR